MKGPVMEPDDRKIEGERNESGQFEVAHWPKPRASNPNFLSELLADWQAAQKNQR